MGITDIEHIFDEYLHYCSYFMNSRGTNAQSLHIYINLPNEYFGNPVLYGIFTKGLFYRQVICYIFDVANVVPVPH